MKCQVCVDAGVRSRLADYGGTSTCMAWTPYHDEDGVYHSHDPNNHSRHYRCSRGHDTITKSRSRCPNCDYGGTL